MIEFKSKGLVVTAGVDAICQVVVTTDGGQSWGMPFGMFKDLFEPLDDESKAWLKMVEQRLSPPAFGFEIEKDEDGNVKGIKTTGKAP